MAMSSRYKVALKLRWTDLALKSLLFQSKERQHEAA